LTRFLHPLIEERKLVAEKRASEEEQVTDNNKVSSARRLMPTDFLLEITTEQ
jgi:hypothetical protein